MELTLGVLRAVSGNGEDAVRKEFTCAEKTLTALSQGVIRHTMLVKHQEQNATGRLLESTFRRNTLSSSGPGIPRLMWRRLNCSDEQPQALSAAITSEYELEHMLVKVLATSFSVATSSGDEGMLCNFHDCSGRKALDAYRTSTRDCGDVLERHSLLETLRDVHLSHLGTSERKYTGKSAAGGIGRLVQVRKPLCHLFQAIIPGSWDHANDWICLLRQDEFQIRPWRPCMAAWATSSQGRKTLPVLLIRLPLP
ncbi:hypothetical protein C8Q80DRAFT_236744 [Daedaleopsis nitida]|nr:hypothetical protein C8Q80DRAFT_236744 [Daedaleopsis nitida]